jgi:hypothetical protein
LILTLYLPDKTADFLARKGQDPRKAAEKALEEYVQKEREFLKSDPYDDRDA